MALTVGELQVLLSGDTRKLNRDLDQLDSRAGKTEQVHTAAWKRIAVTAGAAIAAIGIGAFIADTAKIGIEYTNQLNTLQAVSGATAEQMANVGRTAKTLGSDLTLPATSAADAAAVMTELAKASFSVEDAQQAAKGSLQLAAAAQIEGAAAATIQANALQAFNIKASDAGRVADVLANSANASSAEITDVADALAQAGAVASAANISIEDTAATIGILANNGIRGSDAGTLLKSALLALRDTSKPAQAAMDALNLSVYDAQGNFVGLESIFGDLAEAQSTMSQEAFEAATNVLFGSDASRLAGIAAKTGAVGFDVMRQAMGKQGAAADVAAAKAKGLGGAIEGFKSQVETFQIDLFERASPNIEKLVRYASENLPEIGNAVLDGVDDAIAGVGRLKDGAVTAFEAIARYVSPVTDELDDLWASLTATHGPAQAAWGALKAGGAILLGLAKAAQPVVELGGGLLRLFNSLPGPLQTVVLAFAALKVATSFDFFGKLAGSQGAVTSSLGRSGQSVVGFAQTVRTNMRLAGDDVGALEKAAGGLSAGFQTYFPKATGAVQNFGMSVGSAFQQAKQLQRFKVADIFGTDALRKGTGDVAGFSAALKNVAKQGIGGLKSAAGGLASFMGGPWGVAMAGVGVGVALISSEMQKATETNARWAEGIAAGGAAAAKAIAEAQAAAANHPDNAVGDWFHDMNVSMGLVPDSAGAAKKASEEYWRSLDPIPQAQAKVAEWTNTLSYRLDKYGEGSDEVAAAQGRLAYWTGEVATRQGELDAATQSATGALQAQTAAALAGANADLAASQANTQLATAREQYNKSLADGTLTATQHQQATDAMTAAAYGAAAAAAAQAKEHSTAEGAEGKQADADRALLASLQATAKQLGSNTPAAITNLIGSLQASAGTASTTSARMKDLGLSVVGIPNSKFVDVKAPTDKQMADLKALGVRTETLPDGNVRIYADTGPAGAALAGLVRDYQGRTIYMEARISGAATTGRPYSPSGNGGGRASGGPVSARVPYLVGEGGREMFVPEVPGWIATARQTAEIMAAGNSRAASMLASGGARMGSAGTGSANVGGVTEKHYHSHATVTHAITPREFVALQREAEALYG